MEGPNLPVGESTLPLTGAGLVFGLDDHHSSLRGTQLQGDHSVPSLPRSAHLDGVGLQVLLAGPGRDGPLDGHDHLGPLVIRKLYNAY